MIKNGIRKQDTLLQLHQANPAKIEIAAIKHYTVEQYFLFSYHVLSDVKVNENYICLFYKTPFRHVQRYA